MIRIFLPMLVIFNLCLGGSAFGQPVSGLVLPVIESGRLSAFYFNDELELDGQPPQVITLHASAIQTGGGNSGRVWINGVELAVNDYLGPIRITAITNKGATLELAQAQGSNRYAMIAINQTLILESPVGSPTQTQIVGVHEGVGAMLRRLPLTGRLP